MVDLHDRKPPHQVVIVGGGFGGLYAAKALAKANVNVTLIDKRNFHLFQPLLYQVATGALSPADISSPLRSVLSKSKNTTVLLGEVNDIDTIEQKVIVGGETVPYDTLIVATGAKHSYFGKDNWEEFAPGLKTVEDAIEMRRRIFMAFEAAEKESDPAKRRALLTFVIVGGGPTGVELAGAIAELATQTLKEDFRNIDTSETKVLLLEGLDRVLPPFAPELSQEAQASLEALGVDVQTKTLVTNIENDIVTIKQGDEVKTIASKTVLWAAGVKASAMGKVLMDKTGAECDRAGRVIVEPDLSIKGHSNIFVVGDLANFAHQNGKPLPGVAPVAMQEGEYVAKLVQKRIKGENLPQFNYVDRGSLAMIGQHAAVVDLGFIKLKGFLAWFFWLFIHIYFLIEFDNKLVVMIQWVWNYFTRNRGARLITGKEMVKPVPVESNGHYQPVNTRQPLNV
ncbi:MAG: NAD(P)/FAD-dependent oxidoreductase [Sphaerospermopsis kisseleviana]|uniref:NADH:ubiquinone reductase (non-electrogenic) n=2 Tax=Sphaerospermopsis TaxID=752201 RepID=A0A480A007_9CYAN|nr:MULTISPECIES: NAD(P)/FAD-dependent oxidoreductase [Sphaerospermopsis]MBD2132663.1 NAD(P)/FAD-dependent oxidoreductase [Sphaerospermopsis sp. FACHB-1094]MBD2144114.1 NAD(P)/FAD-dependent oxidoreductase [Sphaerospermopsis sp. FACHB-1194]MBE9236204.1 NAD(P)/FAD-dependent oxidoreductase [Sphaerospermopsis aphanizomenoides LEGE 00250]GCL36858.1 FAD-dependent pyridine nucleotide-disulfide oxidoreductase [Sphaerospermopsis reniformis]